MRVNTMEAGGNRAQDDDGNKKNQFEVDATEVSSVHSGSETSQVVGSADMFDENGNIRLIPVGGLVYLHLRVNYE